MTSYIWHCFCTYCTKKYRCLLHFSIIMSHSACRAQQCFKQDQKCKTKTKTKTKAARPRPRPRPVWDQSCHKTAVSDPKTDFGEATTAKRTKIDQHCQRRNCCALKVLFNDV